MQEPAPTFMGTSATGVRVCIEVNESFYPITMNEFVADCIKMGLPVKLYTAVPANPNKTIDQTSIQRAEKFGVGCLLVDNGRITVLREALDLSLLLTEDEKNISKFPKKFRLELNTAISTYENGDPKKGVSNVFDTIEGIIRNVAIQAKANGTIPAANTLDLKRAPWVNVMMAMQSQSVLNDVFLSRCIGSSTTRNYTSHPAKNLKEIQKMHKRLRTNYNYSIDLLKDLIEEAKINGYKI